MKVKELIEILLQENGESEIHLHEESYDETTMQFEVSTFDEETVVVNFNLGA